MRIVTGLAAFRAHRRVLEHKGSAFLGVALQAGLFAAQRLFHHAGPRGHPPRRRERSMWVVAVRAGHESFIDAVLERHRELRANGRMAGITEVRLPRGQKVFLRWRLVDGMAIRAYDA